MKKTLCVLALIAVAAFGQARPAFEVATIKTSAPPDTAKMIAALQAGGQMPLGAHVGAHGPNICT
jgi:hypothetical protein